MKLSRLFTKNSTLVIIDVSAEPVTEVREADPNTDEPSGNICTWRPEDDEEASRSAFITNSDVTIAAPTVHPEHFGDVVREHTAMGPSLPAEKVSATSQGGNSLFGPSVHRLM